MFEWFQNGKKISQSCTGSTTSDGALCLQAANDNCFYRSLLGNGSVFEIASNIRQMREGFIHDPDHTFEGRIRLIDSCDTFLRLFEALFVDDDVEEAKALAPKINEYVPELMVKCPDIELRPDFVRE